MAPFTPPRVIVDGFKEKIESLTVQGMSPLGDRLYVGTNTGNLHIYSLDDDAEERITLVETKKGLARKPIEQLGFIKDINSLVVLAEAQLTLYPLPGLAPSTPLVKTKTALSFAIHSAVQHLSPEGNAIPTLITQLAAGCRRKVVIYLWKDGEAQEVREAGLPHSPREISFLNHETACFAYSPTEYAVFSLQTLIATEISTPLPVTASVAGMTRMGALTGLTGYMTLGLGAKPKTGVIRINDNEAFIMKDTEGFAIGLDGKPSRKGSVEWPAPPEEIAFVKPYIISILPPGSVPSSRVDMTGHPDATAPSFIPSSVIQVRSALSLLPTQTLQFPSPSTSPSHISARLLTPSPTSKPSLFLVTTPIERAAATAEGSSIWHFCMKSWGTQIDELVQSGSFADALALLDTIDQAVLSDKEQRQTQIRALHAVSLFHSGKFDEAINTFIALDINPAKVVALYPESIAGRLAVPPARWIPLYGGPTTPEVTSSNSSSAEGSRERPAADAVSASPSGAALGMFKGLGAFMPSGIHHDEDAASISSKQSKKKKTGVHDDLHRSVETLLRFVTDRRPKVAGALASIHITPAQSHKIAFLSETSTEDLFALPNAPLPSLTPEQLLRFAQILDTALFKSYLLMRPGLLPSLCRVPNWCEVSEVEEELRAREKYAELIYLYNGKKMHAKALDLLRHLSEKETDMTDKLSPSISYLQKLGPEHIDQIFDSSRWLFEQDQDKAFAIFTSEDVELPRQNVADYLEGIEPQLCARYLEFIIEERGEKSTSFHDRLAELYLTRTLSALRRGDDASRKKTYAQLLRFIDSTHHYQIDRLYALISSHDLFEARAILLGRLGRHDQALELYVYRLQDYLKAEEYCKRVYQPGKDTSQVFLTLLRIYLQPTVKTSSDLLQPALGLISRHSPRLDPVETLQLLPPLVTAQDVRTFLLEALRAPLFDTHVIREIGKSRNDQLARTLMVLQSNRVKVTDSRICPQCHKRIGNSVIAVHAPRGEVTHYQCREPFSRKLNERRR